MSITLKVLIVAMVAISDMVAAVFIVRHMSARGQRKLGLLIAQILAASAVLVAIVLFMIVA